MEHSASRGKGKIVLLFAILGMCVAAMFYFAFALFSELHMTRQGQNFYASLSVEMLPRSGEPGRSPQEGGFAAASPEEEGGFIDFDAKRGQFPSIVGWIQSEGTVINYPIVKGPDNDFYLYRLADGTPHAMGSIFMDYRNAADFSDRNIIIYGHDMRSGDKFGSFRNYADQEYFEAHHSMFILTPDANFELMLFAGYVLDSSQEVPPMDFFDEAHFNRYIADIRRRSIFRSDLEVGYGSRLVFLATCTPGGSVHERLILVGKLAEF
ncbi:MAG: class B sortase [Defluviitaleaceae bacterium]|nr:class B sortase [Defluviitaleaceae bacterium]